MNTLVTRAAILVLSTLLLAARAEAAQPAVRTVASLTEEAAGKIVAAARDKAAALESGMMKGQKCRMHIHVLGRQGTLLAASQAIGAWQGSSDIAGRKARTSWLFKMPTRTVGELSRLDQPAKAPLYGIELSNGGLISFPGGLPIFDSGGGFVGSIGVSGDTVDNDELVARAGVDAAKALGAAAVTQMKTLTQAGAMEVLQAAMATAEKTRSASSDSPVKMHVYVLGLEGTVLAASHADDAFPGSADIAYRKARTAWCFRFPTEAIGQLSRTDQAAKAPLFGIELSNGGLISFAGGLPILDGEGNCVGAIGVSGDAVDKDLVVAQAGVQAFKALQGPMPSPAK